MTARAMEMVTTMKPPAMVQRAAVDLCARFDLNDYNPTPLVDLGALVANADGSVDTEELEALRQLLEPMLGAQLNAEMVGYLIEASLRVIEAAGIEPLVANSPLLGWTYSFLSVQGFSNALGVLEIAVGLMIALRPVSAAVAAAGSALAIGMFATTLSFLLSTPGWEPSLGGFPALSVVPGQFLLKDVVRLGAAVWSLGEALGSLDRS